MSTINPGDPVRITYGYYTGQIVKVAEVQNDRAGHGISYVLPVQESGDRIVNLRFWPNEIESVEA